MRSVDMPPYAPTLMESTRAIGYSIEAAIADIIDNSIAAGAGRIDIDFFPIGQSYISILDNGTGMTEAELISAMQYGSRSPLEVRDENDLGRYGLGMKTASLSQCRILTVISKKNGAVSGCRWDLNHVKQSESWSLIVLDEHEMAVLPNYDKLCAWSTGTIVIWQDLDKFAVGEKDIAEAFNRKMALIREHLSLVFHRYLSGEPGLKKLDIRMNDLSITPQDPFLVKKSTQLMVDTFEFSVKDIDSTMTILNEQIRKSNEYNHIIVPLNTKTSTLATGLVALEHPEIQICYAEPEAYNIDNYSEPGNTVFLYRWGCP